MTIYLAQNIENKLTYFSAKQAKQLTHDEIGFIASNVLSNADLCCDTTNNMLRFFVHIVNTIISILDDGILYTDEEF